MSPFTAQREERTIAAKLFVGNLNFQTTREELATLFGEVGEVVDLFIPTDRATGRPRGFAFVEFASSEEALKAVEKLDGHELGGRQLRVSEAAERRPRAPRMPRGPRYGGGPPAGGGGGDFFESDWDGGAPRGGGGGPARIARPKGSRRNLRRKKRSL